MEIFIRKKAVPIEMVFKLAKVKYSATLTQHLHPLFVVLKHFYIMLACCLYKSNLKKLKKINGKS